MSIRYLSGINVDSNTLFVDDANNRVGIGTDSPSHSLHISGLSTSAIAFGGTSLKMGSYTGIGTTRIYSNGLYLTYSTADSYHDFTNSGSSLMRITNTGNVGIGTTSPTAKLEIGVDSSTTNVGYIRLRGHDTYEANIYKTATYGIYMDTDTNLRPIRIDGSAFITGITGNVGIGTTSPTEILHVEDSSSIQLKLNQATASTSVRMGSGTSYFQLAVGTGGATNALNILHSNAYVGIGTTSPSTKLEVSSAGANGINISVDSNNSSVSGRLFLSNGTSGQSTVLMNNGGNLAFHTQGTPNSTSGSERMRIDSSGNVGIGTTSPATKLHIANTTSSNPLVSLRIENDLNYSEFGTQSGYARILSGGYLLYAGSTSSTYFYNGGSVVMSTHSSGNVGIGTTSPLSKLQVRAGLDQNFRVSSSTNLTVASINDADTAYAPITFRASTFDFQNGNVGIGTTSPSSMLTLNGITPYIRLERGGAPTWEIRQNYPSTEYGFQVVNVTNSNIPFFIGESSKVGIGTTSPSQKLEVAGGHIKISSAGYGLLLPGSINTSAQINFKNVGTQSELMKFPASNYTVTLYGATDRIYYKTDKAISNQNVLSLGTDGNVGIGTTSPGYKLHVVGDTRIEGNLTINGTVTQIDTDTLTTEQWLVTNDGTGPAVVINQKGTQPVVDIQDDGTSVLYIEDGGDVGIGTTSPGAKLEVNSSDTLPIIRARYNASYYTDYDSNGIQFVGTGQNFNITDNGNSVLYLKSGGNVGIGTTSPTSPLHISSSTNKTISLDFSTVGDGTFTWASFQQAGAEKFRVWGGTASGNTYLSFYNTQNSTHQLILASNGNVGIGTTSPSTKLDVIGVGAFGTMTSSRGSYSNGLSLQNNTGEATSLFLWQSGVASAHIGSPANSTSLHIVNSYNTGLITDPNSIVLTNTGNVGIGTTTPLAKLDVEGAQSNFVARFSNSTTTGYAPGSIILEAGQSAARGQGIYHYNTPADESWFTGVPYDVYSKKWIVANNYATTFDPNVAQLSYALMTIDSDTGNVGIGTTSPTAKLHVDNSSADAVIRISKGASTIGNIDLVNEGNRFSIQDDGARRLVIDTSGNVGIGTTSPNAKLAIKDGSNADLEFFSESSGTALQSFNRTTSTWGYLRFLAGGGEQMRIHTNGNVGIGTTSPSSSYKLDVAGAIRTTVVSGYTIDASATFGDNSGGTITIINRGTTRALRILGTTSSGWGDVLINPYGAYVGIGTTDPTQALHVSGSARVTGAYYDSNNSAGTSGQVLSSTGSGTAWVNQGEATATSLFDLLPAARVTYDWTVQLTAGTWADIFSSTTVLSNGTWMVQAYVSDFAVGGQQYQETYSGIMSWGNAQSTNEVGPEAISEVVLHRSGHAANAGNFYLRTVERASSTLLLQGMSNLSHTASTTINFKFVKIF